jgi:hypothetical protein
MAKLSFLPHQYQLITDTETKILGMCAGFGSGKTYSLARKAVSLAVANPGDDIIVTEPNFPLLTQILIPELKAAFKDFHIEANYKSGDGIFYSNIYDPATKTYKESRMICKSMENWEKLIGISAAAVLMDEADVAKPDVAYNAFLKLLGRIRVGNVRQMVIASTPEGFGFLYRVFIEEMDASKRLIQASTYDNPYLPPDYIRTMKQQYPEELIEAYLRGKFTNLASGTVYNSYDRVLNDSAYEDDGTSPLLIGMDFNVQKMAAVVAQMKDEKIYVFDEFFGFLDTPAIIKAIEDKYPNRDIIVYPDAAGQSRQTTDASQTNHRLLRAAGFRVIVDSRNPSVMDRVNTVNARFKNADNDRRLFVNSKYCPELIKCLEQQSYNENTKLPDKTRDTDHMTDALGYLVTKLMPLTFSRKYIDKTVIITNLTKMNRRNNGLRLRSGDNQRSK